MGSSVTGVVAAGGGQGDPTDDLEVIKSQIIANFNRAGRAFDPRNFEGKDRWQLAKMRARSRRLVIKARGKSQRERQNAQRKARRAKVAQKRLDAQIEKERQEQQARDDWNASFAATKGAAFDPAIAYLEGFGLDRANFESDIQKMIDDKAAEYAVGQNFQGAFDNIGQDYFDKKSNELRDQANYLVSDYFRPTLGQELLPDTIDDSAIAAILQQQYGTGLESLERARDRNQITGKGYLGGVENLNKQRENVTPFLEDIANTNLSAERAALSDIASEAAGEASSLNYGQQFQLDPYKNRVQSEVDDFLNKQQGNLSSQAGELFDLGGALSAAHNAQGAQNLGQKKVKKSAGVYLGDNDDDQEEDRHAPTNTIF